MSDPSEETLIVTGHGLQAEGAAFDTAGNRIAYNTVAGVGYGQCSCGERSDTMLDSGAARKQWHRDHKLAVVSETPADEPAP
jgi:hypothetical protein